MVNAFNIVIVLTTILISNVRALYKQAIADSQSADLLVNKTQNATDANLLAYYGTGLALQAKHSWNPAVKLQKAKDAAFQLNLACTKNANDLEIRFLRFSYECNVPSIVGITKHLSADKKYILNNLNAKNPIWTEIKSFLLSSSQVSIDEKNKVKAAK